MIYSRNVFQREKKWISLHEIFSSHFRFLFTATTFFSGGKIAEKSFRAHECAKTTVNITLCGREFTTQKPTQNQDEKNSKENTERKKVLMQNEACFDMPWRHKFKLYRVFPFTLQFTVFEDYEPEN